MLTITVPAIELWNEETETFSRSKETTLQLEHSLISLSKWESVWKVPFLGKGNKTPEQTLDYFKDMTITKGVEPEVYTNMPSKIIDQINEYIADPMTATTFYDEVKSGPAKETITAELIYYWMIAFSINFDCRKWHLNSLLTLIRVCNIKNAPPKKMSFAERAARNRELNASRQKTLGTTG